MNRLLTVAQYEFMTNVKKRSFLWAVFGAPLLSIGLVVVITLVSTFAAGESDVDGENVGYVDPALVLAAGVPAPEGFRAYATDTAARAALEAGEISVYIVIPPVYPATGNVSIFAYGGVSDDFKREVRRWLAASAAADPSLAGAPAERLVNPTRGNIVLENSGRTLDDDPAAFLGLFLVPVVFIILFMTSLQLTSTFLMSGVVEEKANRIMEILVTSVTPGQLLGGKLLGLGLLGLFQVGVWVLAILLALLLLRGTALLSAVVIPPDLVLLMSVYFVVNYFLYASLFAGIGAVTGSEQEARQWAGLLTFPTALPLILLVTFLADPNGTIPTVLTLIPFTSAVTIILRSVFGSVPPEQLALSLGLMLATTVFITWASARVFRWSLLLYGKKPGPRELWRVIRGRAEVATTAAAIQER
ncbi:MAG: ABC transporter permease [Anaerolineae bacterium]|nr:ABC transporter permease [Anaerolineae bacterium]